MLTAFGDELLITELVPHGGVEEIEDGATPVASFRAPQRIISMRCHGATICVGCEGGVVCILQAPFLGVRDETVMRFLGTYKSNLCRLQVDSFARAKN